jgi:riboflavin synthase
VFTGIVRELGRVESVESGDAGARLAIAAGFTDELAEGDSVAVDGVCLTVAELNDGGFAADVMNQTLTLTTLGTLAAGDPVNLEPALRAGDALGGHIVQGHVDGVGEVTRIAEDGFARRLAVRLPPELRRYAVERGSVTLAGASLTVAVLLDDGVEVSLIPETLERTTLGGLERGAAVNVEVDVIARYVERLLGFEKGASRGQ